jgi:hypothetical protein
MTTSSTSPTRSFIPWCKDARPRMPRCQFISLTVWRGKPESLQEKFAPSLGLGSKFLPSPPLKTPLRSKSYDWVLHLYQQRQQCPRLELLHNGKYFY